MESWSASLDSFKVKVFLDTNILCYLVDNTYPALTSFIKTLSGMPVVDLISSEYVLAEFIGVRKQENYFREALKEAKNQNITLNLSSFLKYNKRYEIPNLEYSVVQNAVNTAVKQDERAITNDFNISFVCGFNKNLIKPTKDICLCSRISKEDSLVLVSSIYKNDEELITDKLLLLTNDNDFYSWYDESKGSIDAVFSEIGNVPEIVKIKDITNEKNQRIDLTKQASSDPSDFCVSFIKGIIISFYSKFFKGNTEVINCPSAPSNCVGIKVSADQLENKSYCMILGKNLDFLYCIPHQINLYHCNKPVEKEFTPQSGANLASFTIDFGKDDIINHLDKDEQNKILARIKESGNLLFLHPDGQ